MIQLSFSTVTLKIRLRTTKFFSCVKTLRLKAVFPQLLTFLNSLSLIENVRFSLLARAVGAIALSALPIIYPSILFKNLNIISVQPALFKKKIWGVHGVQIKLCQNNAKNSSIVLKTLMFTSKTPKAKVNKLLCATVHYRVKFPTT